MKEKQSILLMAGLAATLLTPVLALEGPADDAPPPPPVAGDPALPKIKLPADPAAATEPAAEAAFLGVVSGEIPEILAEHLSLKDGVVIRSLVEDGPAAKAGLAVNDVIHSVAGKPVASPVELSERVLAHRPGDEVSLGIIHHGERGEVKVTFGTRPQELALGGAMPLDPNALDGLPKDLAERVRDAIAGNIGNRILDPEADPQMPPDVAQAMRDLQARIQGAIQAPAMGDALKIEGSSTFRMRDNDGSVEVKSTDGAKEVTIRDANDKVTWSGPWDTAQDKAAAPADVRRRVESLNIDPTFKGPGLRFHLNRPPAEPGD